MAQQALTEEGEASLANSIREVGVERCTVSEEPGVGYVYFERTRYPVPAVHNEAAVVARTLPFADPYWFNIDVDHEGNVFGIELMGREDILDELLSQGAP